jgi:peptidoglycan/xylan/chitin deacetylase (PgdA/CDA1 family)
MTTTEPERGRKALALTIQLEDETRLDRARAGKPDLGDPALLERRVERTLQVLGRVHARATFFAEGRLADELAPSAWSTIVAAHELGSQGLSRALVGRLGPDAFADDARRGREALERVANAPVRTFRAPELAAEGCEPWFGRGLADAGYTRDSSLVLAASEGHTHAFPLAGSGDAVTEVPIASVGSAAPRSACSRSRRSASCSSTRSNRASCPS